MASIAISNLRKTYPVAGGGTRLALGGLNLEIDEGQFVCILGPSGCGKTTLLNILSGLDRSYQGSIEMSSRRPQLGRQRDLTTSYMFQDGRLLPWLTIRENLHFVLDGNRNSQAARERVDSWLERVHLLEYAEYFPGQLSMGMQQRVALARALIVQPELLLLDEPFRSLDELTALRMRTELLALWREQRCTVVFVTHNPLEVVYLGDRGILMTPGPGRILEEIPADEFLPRPRHIEDPLLWDASRRLSHKLISAAPDPLGQ